MARTVRRVRLPEVPAGVAGPVAGEDGAGLRRHLLLAPARPGHAAGGDDGRAGHRGALGTALYVGISSYSSERTRQAAAILRELGTPLLIHQPSYSMINRWIERGLLDTLEEVGAGCIAFSPLAQGLLTDRYLNGVPADSRVATGGAMGRDMLTEDRLARVRALNDVAAGAGRALPSSPSLGRCVIRADDVAGHRRKQRRAARGQRRRARPPRPDRRRAGRDRPVRHGRRRRPLVQVQLRVARTPVRTRL